MKDRKLIIKKQQFFSKSIILLIQVIYSCIMFQNLNFEIYPIWVILSFLPIAMIAILAILIDSAGVSINKIHWYFILVFLVYAPIMQIGSGFTPWGITWDSNNIVVANFIVLLWEVTYIIVYRRKEKIKVQTARSKKIDLSKTKRIVMVILSLMSLMIMIVINGFSNLFIRGASGFGNGTFSILFDFFFRSIPVINCALVVVRVSEKNKKYDMILHLICTLILNSPFALSRFWVGCVYLGLATIIIPQEKLKDNRYDYLIIFVLLVLFPAFSLLKKMTLAEVVGINARIDLLNVYNNVDFDAYSMLCRVINYVSNVGFTFGGQIKSVLLFFIPRTIWDIKGTPTGELVSSSQGSYYTNVSSPIMAEGYIDFGLIGVILYAIIFARVFRYIDYRSKIKSGYYDGNNLVVKSFVLGFVIYIMRGALQPAFLRLMGFFLYFIVFWLMENKLKRKRVGRRKIPKYIKPN